MLCPRMDMIVGIGAPAAVCLSELCSSSKSQQRNVFWEIATSVGKQIGTQLVSVNPVRMVHEDEWGLYVLVYGGCVNN